jgi:hypothetical protein
LLAVLLARRDEIALYEDGVSVPELRIEHLGHLLRKPEDFTLRFFRATPATRQVLSPLMRAATATAASEGSTERRGWTERPRAGPEELR